MRNLVTFKSLGRYGRFANQCYQIAGMIGIARRNNMDFGLTEPWRNHNGRDFEPDLNIDVFKWFVNSLPMTNRTDLPQVGIPWGYQDVRLNHSADLLGHFQSEKYFAHAIDEIRWYMTMKDEPPQNDYVAVHVRLGDYGEQPSPQHPGGNPHHPRMNMSYYTPAMKLFEGEKFLVFSDGIETCKEMFGDSVEYSEGQSYLEDFRLMKRCKSFIISNSSFSAFAAVLGNHPYKKVVAPSPWFGGPYLETLDPKDIYNPEWSVIDYRK